MLRSQDKRSKSRKAKEYLRENGGIIIGVTVFSVGVALYIVVEVLRGSGIIK